MRGVKILILIAAFAASLQSKAQIYVQPMGYLDYSFYNRVNIGNRGTKATDLSAYLELGNFAGSNKGFLLPRGNKDSVQSPAKGLMFYDLPSNATWYYNGSAWVKYSAAGGSELDPVFNSSFVHGITAIGPGLNLSSGTLSSTITQFTNEMVDDRVAALIQNGSNITWTYDDALGTLTPTVTSGSTNTAGSGITLSGTAFDLGGAFTQNTTFSGAYDVNFGTIGSKISAFNAYSSGFNTVYGTGNFIQGTSLNFISSPSLYLEGTSSFQIAGVALNMINDTSFKILVADGSGNVRRAPWLGFGGGGGAITLSGDVSGSGTGSITATIGAGKVLESMFGFTDITTANVSTTRHGLTPKLPNDATLFLNGTGGWSAPGGGGGGGSGTVNSGTANRLGYYASTGSAISESPNAITSSRALISDGSGLPTHSTTTSTELGYVSGVTSAIQTQINGKEPTIASGLTTDFTVEIRAGKHIT
jgi:hypothetical protein